LEVPGTNDGRGGGNVYTPLSPERHMITKKTHERRQNGTKEYRVDFFFFVLLVFVHYNIDRPALQTSLAPHFSLYKDY